jgi:flagellar hook-basal body complex protein FliE
MNATNLPPEAGIDSAMLELQRGLVMLRNAQNSAPDSDMYACTLRSVETVLTEALDQLRQHQKQEASK